MRDPLSFALCAMCLVAPAAQAAAADSEPATFSVLFENDIFFNTDRDYTNGVQFAYTTGLEQTPGWAVDAARLLPFFAPTGKVRTGYALGQNIYTPQHDLLAVPLTTERPFAGYLYADLGLMEENDTRLDQLQVELGVVGPMSLAANAQLWVHSILHNKKPQGWHYQLHNEPTAELTYERSLKLIPPQDVLGLVLDIEPHAGGAVGSVYDYLNAGAMVRFGFNLPDDYGPLRIEPGLPGSNFFDPTGDFSMYLFAGVDGRAVARNIFLDGNSWEDSRSVVKKNLVRDLALGIAVTFEDARLTFTHVFRSDEYKNQAKSDQFGAINLSFRL